MAACQSFYQMTHWKFFYQNFFLSNTNRIQFKKIFIYFGVRYIVWEVTQGNPALPKSFLKWKKMQKIFYFKKLRVVLAELRILQFGQSAVHFGSVGRLLIADANAAVCNPYFASFRKFLVKNWLHNNIACNSNITILPNTWTQTRNIAMLGLKFGTQNCFGCCESNIRSLPTIFRGNTGICIYKLDLQQNLEQLQ